LVFDGRLLAKGLDAKANGTMRPFAVAPVADLRVTMVRANAAPLRGLGDARAALPVTFDGRVALAGDGVTVSDINASVGGSALRGQMAWSLSLPHRISGALDADTADGATLLAAAIGMPLVAPSADKSWVWSTEPFTEGVFGDVVGQLSLKVRRLDLPAPLAVRAFGATLRFARREFFIDDMAGDMAGGKLAGGLVYKDTDSGLTAQAKLTLTGADAAALLPAAARPPVAGTLEIAADVTGSGLSPVALIGSLQGGGKLTLTDAQLAGLDPRAFDAVTRAVDQGLAIDAGRIGNVVRTALEGGQLAVKRATGTLQLRAGQLRLTEIAADIKGAELTIGGKVDLADGSLDARVVLSGTSESSGARPDIFMSLKGPVSAPSRTIDVSALTGWLTLRAVDTQARRLRAIEAAQQKPAVPQGNGGAPASDKEMAPVLPAPVDINPVPPPRQAERPAGSVGTQN
ncbi:MAG TPA: AsmA-like C-terminal region-containing protein, partial [Rhizomicrobium sp.]